MNLGVKFQRLVGVDGRPPHNDIIIIRTMVTVEVVVFPPNLTIRFLRHAMKREAVIVIMIIVIEIEIAVIIVPHLENVNTVHGLRLQNLPVEVTKVTEEEMIEATIRNPMINRTPQLFTLKSLCCVITCGRKPTKENPKRITMSTANRTV